MNANNTDGLQGGSQPSRDPIDWAIVAVIVGGASLLLSLEQKIESRRRHEQAEARRKAVAGNKLRLKSIVTYLQGLESVASFVNDRAEPIESEAIDGINRTSIVFPSEEDEEEYNKWFDIVTQAISRINRLLSELDENGWPLTDDDIERFVTNPMKEVKSDTVGVLAPEIGFRDRINKLKSLINKYTALIGSLEAALTE